MDSDSVDIRRRRGRRRMLPTAVLLALTATISATAIGGVLVGVSVEANSDHIDSEPWLVELGGGRFGVEFLTYGRSASAVRYGVIEATGAWISRVRAITPEFGYFVAPWAAYVVADSVGNAYVAWNLYDSDREVEAFHYVWLDDRGEVRATAGPLGASRVQRSEFYVYPQTPAIQLSGEEVHVYWTSSGTRMKVVLDRAGHVLDQVRPTAPGDNGTSLPSRERVSSSYFDHSASVIRDSSATYYLWVHDSYYSGSPRSPDVQDELKYRREAPSGTSEAVLYSTDDSWWLTRPSSLVGIALLVGGSVGSVAIATIAPVQLPKRAGELAGRP